MPLNLSPELIHQAVMERLDREAMQERFAPREETPQRPTTLDPTVAAILGAIADSASTYRFLKNGSGRENNAMYSGFGNKPLPTALGSLGVGLGTIGIAKLLGTPEGGLGKAGPGVSRMLLSGQAANQLGYAGENLDGFEEPSSAALNKALVNEITRQKMLGR